jgi:hypothetical protein
MEQGIYDNSIMLDKEVSQKTTITSGQNDVTINVPTGKRFIEILCNIQAGNTRSLLVYLNGTEFVFTISTTYGMAQINFERLTENTWKVEGKSDDSKSDIFTLSADLSSVKLSFPPGSGQTFASGSYYYVINNV